MSLPPTLHDTLLMGGSRSWEIGCDLVSEAGGLATSRLQADVERGLELGGTKARLVLGENRWSGSKIDYN